MKDTIILGGQYFIVINPNNVKDVDLWEDIENEICAKSTQQS